MKKTGGNLNTKKVFEIKSQQDVKKILGNEVSVGIIGGSGIYNIEEMKNVKEIKFKTPFGFPSDNIIIGELEGKNGVYHKIAFIPRHGRGHTILPTEINSHANIYALKFLGVKKVISISACGSLKEEICPRDVVLPDQLFDRTKLRKSTYFGEGIVGHISFDEPYCLKLRKLVFDCCQELGLKTHFGGTYVCIEGPQFSTKAESYVNRQLGFSIVGMTALPEAKLAREAEMCYVTVALVTDYDVWKEGEEVTAEKVVENLNANVENSKRLIKKIVSKLDFEEKCECNESLKYAIFTRKDKINKKTLKKLELLIGKYLK